MDGQPLSLVEVEAEEEHTSTVIWLHGLGASGHDFESLVPLLGLPNTRFVFPHAPVMAVTINMGFRMRAWYDILTLEWDSEGREDEESILASAKLVDDLLKTELSRGIPSHKVVLAGFSQGGALALHNGLRYPEKLAGIMVLSAYELRSDSLESEASIENSETPMLFCHGRFDDMVPVQMGRAAHARMTESREAVSMREFNMGHEVIMPEIAAIGEWLAEVINRPGQ